MRAAARQIQRRTKNRAAEELAEADGSKYPMTFSLRFAVSANMAP
jgi:hypothetical protein